MQFRKYASSDMDEIAKLFYDTVHTVNAADYTAAQLDAWAPRDLDAKLWDESLKRHFSLVAEDEGKIVGFGDIDESGYLDRLYVRAEYIGKGVGKSPARPLGRRRTRRYYDARLDYGESVLRKSGI